METFVFSTRLSRVTAQLRGGSYREALDDLAREVTGWAGGTRIGESLAAQVRAAQEKATSLEQDAERKHTEIMTTIKKQQTTLEGRIEELRTYEREYRTRLKTFLESQLEELNSRSTAAPAANNINFGKNK